MHVSWLWLAWLGGLDRWANWLEVGRVDRGQVQLCLSLGLRWLLSSLLLVVLVAAVVAMAAVV